MAVPEEIAVAYVSLIPSARGIEKNIAAELAPVTGIASTQGEVAGAALGGSFVQKFAGKTGNLLQGVDKQLGSFGGPFSGNLTTIGTSLRAVESGQLKVASGASDLERVATGAYVGIGLAAAGFGAVSIKSALGAEQAEAQLAQAFTATGNSIDDYGSQLDGARKKLAGFGFDNEQVNASLAQLVRVTKDPAKSVSLLALAADTARARNEDLATSTQRLVNVEAGRIRGLTQLGISTKDANGKTITSEEAIQRITALYGGSAAANAKTYQGELEAVGATAHNLEEELGGKLLPVVANVGDEILSGVHGLEDINQATDGWLGTLAGAAVVTGGVIIAVNKIGSGVSHLTDLLNLNKAATEGVAAAQAASAGGDIGVVVGASAPEAVQDAQLTIARSKLATATAAATEAQAEFDAALLTGAGAEEADLTAATALAEADSALAVAKQELAAATAQVTALTETETVANSGLGVSLAAVTGGLAAAAGGLVLGVAAGHKLNDLIVGTKPNVDELTKSLIELRDGSQGADFSGIADDLKHQINVSGPSDLPVAFGKSLLDSVTGGDAHRAKSDISDLNDALKGLLQTDGADKATASYGKLVQSLEASGVPLATIAEDFGPFQSALDLAWAREKDVKGTTDDLSGSFTDLASSFAKDTAKLGLADQLDAAKSAVDDLNQLKLDAAGQGEKSKQAAEQETQAQSSLTDAYRSQETAATSLTDAKTKLAQFDGPTDSRIRSLQQQQIEDRVVTTPEEARQKEIDLLQFSEDNANKRADLQSQVVSAENGVVSATEGVAKAQQSVSDAAKARRDVQTQAAAAIEGAERKAKEAIDQAGTAIQNAKIAGQLGKGNDQLNIYVGLLDQLAHRVDPNSPLSKGLDQFLAKAATANFNLPGPFVPGQPSTFGGLTGTQAQSGPFLPGVPSTFVKTPAVSQPAAVVIQQHNEFHGNDVPTTSELDTLNKKQAIRLRVGAR